MKKTVNILLVLTLFSILLGCSGEAKSTATPADKQKIESLANRGVGGTDPSAP